LKDGVSFVVRVIFWANLNSKFSVRLFSND